MKVLYKTAQLKNNSRGFEIFMFY